MDIPACPQAECDDRGMAGPEVTAAPPRVSLTVLPTALIVFTVFMASNHFATPMPAT